MQYNAKLYTNYPVDILKLQGYQNPTCFLKDVIIKFEKDLLV